MTTKGIDKVRAREAVRVDAAASIRAILDKAAQDFRKLGGDPATWDEADVLELVTADDD